ncbi:MAG: hypothetical protein L6V93_19810 [Clostridiales bacterium]|nr:MAG: hypothetical protein L6V93_19810 [Clostridiales bacterium]
MTAKAVSSPRLKKDVSLLESVEITNEKRHVHAGKKSGDEYIANGDNGIEISKTRVSFLFDEICSVTAEKEVEKCGGFVEIQFKHPEMHRGCAFFSDGDVTFKNGRSNVNGFIFFSRLTATFISSARRKASCLQIRFRITETRKF